MGRGEEQESEASKDEGEHSIKCRKGDGGRQRIPESSNSRHRDSKILTDGQ